MKFFPTFDKRIGEIDKQESKFGNNASITGKGAIESLFERGRMR